MKASRGNENKPISIHLLFSGLSTRGDLKTFGIKDLIRGNKK